MAKDIWQSKENPNEFFGNNSDLTTFNEHKNGTLLVENEVAFEMFSEGEPLALQSTAPVNNELVTQKTKPKKKPFKVLAEKNGKNIEIEVKQVEGESPMIIPPVVMAKNKKEQQQEDNRPPKIVSR